MNPLLEQFIEEAYVNLAFIKENSSAMLKGDDDKSIEPILKRVRTIKSGSAIIGFGSINEIVIALEEFLSALPSTQLHSFQDVDDTLYEAYDEVLSIVEASETYGTIVDGDKKRILALISRLKEAKEGLSTEKRDSFHLRLCKNSILVVNGTYSTLPTNLPLNPPIVTEHNLDETLFYGVLFNSTNRELPLKNDPIEALDSLSKEPYSISSCINRRDAKKIFNGEKSFFINYVAIVKASYLEIERAFSKFIHNIEIQPLSVELLLNATNGTKKLFNEVEVLSKNTKKAVSRGEFSKIYKLISDTILLIDSKSNQAKRLSRLLQLLEGIIKKAPHELPFIIDSINSKKVYVCNSGIKEVLEIGPTKNNSAVVSFQAEDEIVIYDFLKQLKTQIENSKDSQTQKRVEDMILLLAKHTRVSPSLPFSSKGELVGWIESALDNRSMIYDELNIGVDEYVSADEAVDKKMRIAPEELSGNLIDELNRTVSELSVATSSLHKFAHRVVNMRGEDASRLLLEKHNSLNKLINRLQKGLKSAQKSHISSIFDNLPKAVNAIASEMKKEVRLNIKTDETVITKDIQKLLSGSITNVARTIIENEFEERDIKDSTSRSAERLIEVRAFSQFENIVIEIMSNGSSSSLDLDMSRASSQLRELGGSLKVNRGNLESIVTLTVPLIFSAEPLLHVVMNEINYAFPINSVRKTLNIAQSDIMQIHNREFLALDGETVPLFFIEELVGSAILDKREFLVVVLDVQGSTIGVVVNELIDEIEVTQKPISSMLSKHPIFSATALLEDDKIILVIDPVGVLKMYQNYKIAS